MRRALNTCKHLNKHHVSKANFHSSLSLPLLSLLPSSSSFLSPSSLSLSTSLLFSTLSLSPSSFYLPPPNSLPPFFLLLSSYPPLLTPPPSSPSSLPPHSHTCIPVMSDKLDVVSSVAGSDAVHTNGITLRTLTRQTAAHNEHR